METPEQRTKRILNKDKADKELDKARCALYLASTQFTHQISLASLSQLIDAVYVQSDLYKHYGHSGDNIELLIRFMQRLSKRDLSPKHCDDAVLKLAREARIKTYEVLFDDCSDFGPVYPIVTLSKADQAYLRTTRQQNLA